VRSLRRGPDIRQHPNRRASTHLRYGRSCRLRPNDHGPSAWRPRSGFSALGRARGHRWRIGSHSAPAAPRGRTWRDRRRLSFVPGFHFGGKSRLRRNGNSSPRKRPRERLALARNSGSAYRAGLFQDRGGRSVLEPFPRTLLSLASHNDWQLSDVLLRNQGAKGYHHLFPCLRPFCRIEGTDGRWVHHVHLASRRTFSSCSRMLGPNRSIHSRTTRGRAQAFP
jgi:hypothetical protein